MPAETDRLNFMRLFFITGLPKHQPYTNSPLKLYNNVSYFLCVICGFFSLCPLWETES